MRELLNQVNEVGLQYGFRFIPNNLYCEYIYKHPNGCEYKGKCALNKDTIMNKANYIIAVINQDTYSTKLF